MTLRAGQQMLRGVRDGSTILSNLKTLLETNETLTLPSESASITMRCASRDG